jgi:hypothetical protein
VATSQKREREVGHAILISTVVPTEGDIAMKLTFRMFPNRTSATPSDFWKIKAQKVVNKSSEEKISKTKTTALINHLEEKKSHGCEQSRFWREGRRKKSAATTLVYMAGEEVSIGQGIIGSTTQKLIS